MTAGREENKIENRSTRRASAQSQREKRGEKKEKAGEETDGSSYRQRDKMGEKAIVLKGEKRKNNEHHQGEQKINDGKRGKKRESGKFKKNR